MLGSWGDSRSGRSGRLDAYVLVVFEEATGAGDRLMLLFIACEVQKTEARGVDVVCGGD